MLPPCLLLYLALFLGALHRVNCSSLVNGVQKSLDATDLVLRDILTRWQVQKYPNFLKSAFMSVRSWNYLKKKMEQKVLASSLSTGSRNFTIVFTGSSVTSGQDSDFDQSFPVLVERIMKPAFLNLNVNLVVRNVAFGNNPCLPYDVCVRTFAGDDADVVIWEQSYNCLLDRDLTMQEQFVRQSKFIHNKPVVVFSTSDTPNWSGDECRGATKQYQLTPNDLLLLQKLNGSSGGFNHVVTSDNKDIIKKWGRNILTLLARYSNIPLQMFRHDQYSVYKCQGPYVRDWSSGNAAWHPSVLGHSLRAAHYSFVWLQVWRSAMTEIRVNLQREVTSSSAIVSMPLLEKMSREVNKEMSLYLGNTLPPRLWESSIPDQARCFTSFSPRALVGMSLESLISSGLEGPESGPDLPGWRFEVFEALMDADYLMLSKRRGYLDMKIAVYGNDLSGAITLEFKLHNSGTITICEPPAVWGKYPDGFGHIWSKDDAAMSILSMAPRPFFSIGRRRAENFLFVHEHESDCLTSKQFYSKGPYTLSILPRSEKNILLSSVILP